MSNTTNRDRRKFLRDENNTIKRGAVLMLFGILLMTLLAYVSVNDVFAEEIKIELDISFCKKHTSYLNELGYTNFNIELIGDDWKCTAGFTYDPLEKPKMREKNPELSTENIYWYGDFDTKTTEYTIEKSDGHWLEFNDDGSVIKIQGEIYAENCKDYDVTTCTLTNPPVSTYTDYDVKGGHDVVVNCSPVAIIDKFPCGSNEPQNNFLKMLFVFGLLSMMATGIIIVKDDL